ncbi:nitrogen fixation protein NifU [Streptomyces sp. NRRL F-4489]|uniref:NifU family protein n=1 Tax=Streptomyces sp. NRRL F-4489 TaxID=1609095 RepID=UPI00074932FB|nr:NifU family protein [Streptomyces sp. NRRL F-4489]KUL45973.1 nitrogen fixation protein NifU [Streptomyces sp. NRRL F-4489]
MADPARLDDTAVGGRLTRINELLERLEAAPGPTVQDALAAVRSLTEVYGEALARVLDRADPALARELADDELVGHLMVLHGVHPEPVATRVARAVRRLRDQLRERGADLELAGIDGQLARVRLTAKGCGAGTDGVLDAVRETILAVAPELDGVELEPAAGQAPAAFVPLETVTRRPAQPQGAP